MERLTAYENILPLIEEHMAISTAGTEYDSDAKSLTSRLRAYAKQVRTIAFCQRVLETLSFEEIHRRRDGIPDAHRRTFEWIFDRNTTDFSNWASRKNGRILGHFKGQNLHSMTSC